jgi:iron(III) transport system substrate-binding protein
VVSYFLRYFSSTSTEQISPDSAAPFTSFDPVGFAIFATHARGAQGQAPARLFQSFCFTPEAQQLIIDYGGMRSEHLQTKEKPGRKPFREIKVMKEDAVSVERMSEEIKARYTKIFGV